MPSKLQEFSSTIDLILPFHSSHRQTRLREFMKMMGLSDAVLRGSWFVTSGVLLFLSVVGITILLKMGLILPYSDWFIIMLYMLLYALSMIAYR